jgi:hypothetical protein
VSAQRAPAPKIRPHSIGKNLDRAGALCAHSHFLTFSFLSLVNCIIFRFAEEQSVPSHERYKNSYKPVNCSVVWQ